MNIVVAIDSFKGTLTSQQAGAAVAEGIRRVQPDARVLVLPVADGGEGTVEAILTARGGSRHSTRVTGPLGGSIEAAFGVLDAPAGVKTAVIEMAAASGMTLLDPTDYDPLQATTYGTGELIAAALDLGCRNILVGLGGSATVDGGCGAAQALGVRFYDVVGDLVPTGIGGWYLDQVCRIDLTDRDRRVGQCRITAWCDVDNPLCGPTGAARTFGPQKGATPKQVELLDENLLQLSDIIQGNLGVDVSTCPGGGAAGGLGAGLMAFLGAELVPGIEAVLDAIGFDEHISHADLVVTGEGCLDAQSAMGKVVAGVGKRARAAGVPVIAIAGSAGPGANDCLGFLDAYYVVSDLPLKAPPESAVAADLLTRRTAEVFSQHHT